MEARIQLRQVQLKINRICKMPLRKWNSQNEETKKFYLATLNNLQEQKLNLLNQIINN